MLKSLRLENIGLLDTQELSFESGFTVITGETGAGKSILLDSLDVLLGGTQPSFTSGLLTSKKNFFLIEGNFLLTPLIQKWLKDNLIDYENNEFSISREWRLKDERLKSRFRINGILINKHQIRDIRALLIDFTYQGDAYKINSSIQQLECLDKIGEFSLKQAKLNTKLSWQKWFRVFQKLQTIKNDITAIKLDFQKSQDTLNDLENANLEDSEELLKLKKEQDKLVNVVTLKEVSEKILFILEKGTDDLPSVIDQISLCNYELKRIIKNDTDLVPFYDDLTNLQELVKNFINSYEYYYSSLCIEPDQLERIQERINFLQKIQKRYDSNLSELIQKRDELRVTILSNDINQKYDQLQEEEKLLRIERDNHNLELTKLRKKVAQNFEILLKKSLTPLGLLNARFQVFFEEIESNETGVDSVQFLFSANPGQPMRPLNEIASGGEMSRFILGLKTILFESHPPRIFIFDEIDAGVSGKISQAVAKLLKKLSLKGQVFCVTHQPLLAAIADHHFSVTKITDNGFTRSEVKHLNSFSERKNELAELAGGDIGEAKLYAASLLEQEAA